MSVSCLSPSGAISTGGGGGGGGGALLYDAHATISANRTTSSTLDTLDSWVDLF